MGLHSGWTVKKEKEEAYLMLQAYIVPAHRGSSAVPVPVDSTGRLWIILDYKTKTKRKDPSLKLTQMGHHSLIESVPIVVGQNVSLSKMTCSVFLCRF